MRPERSLISVIFLLLSILCLVIPNDGKAYSPAELSQHPNIDTAKLNNMKQYQSDVDTTGVIGNDEENFVFKEKRGRFQGFCFRRARNGRKLPYICWRDAEWFEIYLRSLPKLNWLSSVQLNNSIILCCVISIISFCC